MTDHLDNGEGGENDAGHGEGGEAGHPAQGVLHTARGGIVSIGGEPDTLEVPGGEGLGPGQGEHSSQHQVQQQYLGESGGPGNARFVLPVELEPRLLHIWTLSHGLCALFSGRKRE